jgi:hypothetical protein
MNMQLVTNHWDMLQLLTYSALGAKVQVDKLPQNKEDTSNFRKYTISIEGIHPGLVVSQTHIYGLPCSPEAIQKQIKVILLDLHKTAEKQRATLSS